MSKPNVNIGNSYDGTVKGKINFIGKKNVEIGDTHNYNIGGKASGEVDENGTITFDETITTTQVKQDNTDIDRNAESCDPSSSRVEKYQLESNQIKPVGFHIKGHMTIFNQEFRNSFEWFRGGSAQDVEYLKVTFQRLGLEPMVKADLKLKDIVKEIDALTKFDFSAHKLFVCVYMSHGEKNGIVSAADKEFNLKNTIIDPIMSNKSLSGIPKIFITVACRGPNNFYECDGERFDGRILSTSNDIDYSNCIISYSTYEGHVSKRTQGGTYFIRNLCDNINEDDGDTKIHSLFARVNGKLAEMFKQVPEFKTTMGDICFKDLANTC